VERQDWCIQWSGDILPEAAMVPDPGVFVQCEPAFGRQRWQPEQIPARLRLPFRLSRSGARPPLLAPGQSGAPIRADSASTMSGEKSI